MSKQLPPNPSFEQLKKQAKDLLKACQAGDFDACSRFQKSLPRFSDSQESDIQSEDISLAEAQLVIAREYGFESWPRIKSHITSLTATEARESQLRRIFEAIASGDMEMLKTLLEDNSELKQQIQDAHRMNSRFLTSISRE